jgi:hypothetical protein
LSGDALPKGWQAERTAKTDRQMTDAERKTVQITSGVLSLDRRTDRRSMHVRDEVRVNRSVYRRRIPSA